MFSKFKEKFYTKAKKKIISFLHLDRVSINEKFLNEIYDIFISSNVGQEETESIIEDLKKLSISKEASGKEIFDIIAQHLEKDLLLGKIKQQSSPTVIFVSGVNGNGKTSFIGKYANLVSSQNSQNKTLVIACDNFRAAAVSQLEILCKRANAEIFIGEDKMDAATVAYKGISHAIQEKYDQVIIDTAGRLSNHKNLMDELKKIVRVSEKLLGREIDYKFIVIDGTTGQNALNQVESFSQAISLNGVIISKMDGSSRGGIIFPICRKFQLPIFYVTHGETFEDISEFDMKFYIESLLAKEENLESESESESES